MKLSIASSLIVLAGCPIAFALTACGSTPEQTGAASSAQESTLAAARSPDELARAQAFVGARYLRSAVRHSFRTPFGETIDCIDFAAQAGVRSLAARGVTVPEPRKPAVRPVHPNDARSAAFDGAIDEDGNERFCEGTTVPKVRIDVDDVELAGGVDRFLSVLPREGRVVAPTGPGATVAHVESQQFFLPPFDTGRATLSVFTPTLTLNQTGDHSLEQTWTTGGSQETVEAGWTVDPAVNATKNPLSPHLFIYATPDGYKTGCYNGTVPANTTNDRTCPPWIALPSTLAAGQTLPSSSSTSPPTVVEITVTTTLCSVTGDCPAGWEIQVQSGSTLSNVGYYPASDFSGTFVTAAATFAAGGEVADTTDYNPSTGTNGWTVPMGSGQPANAGYGFAAYARNYAPYVNGAVAGAMPSASRDVATAPYATAGITAPFGNVETSSFNFFYLGAPCGPQTCAQVGAACGQTTGACGAALNCGSCAAGDYCSENECVSCGTCESAHAVCGTVSNACGQELQCGTCPEGQTCENGACLGGGGTNGVFCTNCRKTGGICTVQGETERCIHE